MTPITPPNGAEQTTAATSFEQQHEKNMHILGLIRDEPAWALSRILLAERLEVTARKIVAQPFNHIRSEDLVELREALRGY